MELQESLAVHVEGAFYCCALRFTEDDRQTEWNCLLSGGGLSLHPRANLGRLAVGKSAMRRLALTYSKELSAFHVHAATITACGTMQQGTFYDPGKIAEVYWQFHSETPGQFREELIYREGSPP